MTTLRFLDTNVLLYSISRDPVDAPKREIAIALLDADSVALSVQVLQEFYEQATGRPGQTHSTTTSQSDSFGLGCDSKSRRSRSRS